MRRTSTAALLTAVGVTVGVSLLPVTAIDEGVVLATKADLQAVPAASAAAPRPPPAPWSPLMSPEVDVQEITKPGEGGKVAIFNNGQVYIGYSRARRYLVTHADGSRGERMIDEGIHLVTTTAGVPVPLPLLGDPRFAGVHPSPEQMAEMARITSGG